jgi:hypothetical protein
MPSRLHPATAAHVDEPRSTGGPSNAGSRVRHGEDVAVDENESDVTLRIAERPTDESD